MPAYIIHFGLAAASLILTGSQLTKISRKTRMCFSNLIVICNFKVQSSYIAPSMPALFLSPTPCGGVRGKANKEIILLDFNIPSDTMYTVKWKKMLNILSGIKMKKEQLNIGNVGVSF